MRILHINCNYIGTTLHQLMIEELDRLGLENEVFVPTYDRNLAVIKPNKNVYISECFNKSDRLIFDYKQSKIIASIEKEYDVESFDLIHAYTLFTDGNVARVLSEKYGIPFVVAVRNTDVNDFFKKMIHLRKRGLRTIQKADAVFFLSEQYLNQVFEKYIPADEHDSILAKASIVPNGIDNFWFDNYPSEERIMNPSHVELLYAGRIDKNKNVPTTQNAMSILHSMGYEVSLTVVGKVQDEKEFDIIKSNSKTKCLPPTDKETLIDIYRNADIFVMPSFTESFGLVYAEAMSQGLPVIYSKGQGFDGQFKNGEVGFSVDSNSPESVAYGIKRIIDNYSAISGNCVDKSRKFDWKEICKVYYRKYEEILNKQK